MKPLPSAATLRQPASQAQPPGWQARASDFPAVGAQQLFEQQVARTPEAIAVCCGERQLSYRQLNARANQLAHYLRRCGYGPEDLIGVALARTPELVIALLAVWKSGAAYVPLAPDDPPARLAYQVGDAALRLVLTDGLTQPLFAAGTADTLRLDAEWPASIEEDSGNPIATAGPDNLAYVMYTSGSTGQPKGVMVDHRGLVNYLCWAIEAYALQAGDVVPVHSSIAFDLTVTSLYPALLSGGQVELLAETAAAQSLLAALQQGSRRGLVKITPTHLELLSQQLPASAVAGMSRAWVIGGEALSAESLRWWRRHAPDSRLINEYGPTETVVGCCVYEVQPDDPDSGRVAIGKPIANTRLYLLDAAGQPVPPGETGELYIGGAGVARGYLNRPELTRERFLADPFAGDPTARLYRSGDLARERDDGMLEYLGRVDHQVKIGGYRIELGEIDHCLAAHPGVQSCVTVAREDAPGERYLAAYFVPHPEHPPSAGNLRDFLHQRLPDYMLPAHFVRLAALPLNRNGKIDRPGLPAPAPAASPREASLVAAGTATERQLVTIWSKILKLETIGIDDDVFSLGARSLQAARAAAQIRASFSVNLQLRHLFEQPTIGGQAGIIDRLAWLACSGSKPPVSSGPHEVIEL